MKVNLNLGVLGGDGTVLRKDPTLGLPKRLTATQMKNWVNNSGIEDYIKKALTAKIDRYPSNTMVHFYKNIRQHIKAIQDEHNKNKNS